MNRRKCFFKQPLYTCLKRYMTLMELLVAMSLLSGLLLIVFGFFREMFVLNNLSKQEMANSFQERYVESRLYYFFSHLLNENDPKLKDSFQFFTLKDEASNWPSLVFSFNNGSVLDSHFTGHVLARLFVDEGQHLCVAIWPIYKEQDQADPKQIATTSTHLDPRTHMKVEYLLDQVEDVSFSFFTPPLNPEEGQEFHPPKGEWVAEWRKEYQQMPAIVRLDVKRKKKKDAEDITIFAFVLPSSKSPIQFMPNH